MLQNFVSSKSLPHRILSHLCIEHVFSWCCLLYCRIFFFFSLLELVEWNSFKSYSYKMKFCLRQSDSLIPAVLLPCVMIHFKETEQRSIMGPISRNWGKNKQKQSKNNNTQSIFISWFTVKFVKNWCLQIAEKHSHERCHQVATLWMHLACVFQKLFFRVCVQLKDAVTSSVTKSGWHCLTQLQLPFLNSYTYFLLFLCVLWHFDDTLDWEAKMLDCMHDSIKWKSAAFIAWYTLHENTGKLYMFTTVTRFCWASIKVEKAQKITNPPKNNNNKKQQQQNKTKQQQQNQDDRKKKERKSSWTKNKTRTITKRKEKGSNGGRKLGRKIESKKGRTKVHPNHLTNHPSK